MFKDLKHDYSSGNDDELFQGLSQLTFTHFTNDPSMDKYLQPL